jgi:Kef-type K+ transport system membrane component KefB
MPRDTQMPKVFEPLTSTLLLQLFLAFTGLRTSIQLVSGGRLWLYCAAIIAVAISGTLFGCALTLRGRIAVARVSDRRGASQHARFGRAGNPEHRAGSKDHLAGSVFR